MRIAQILHNKAHHIFEADEIPDWPPDPEGDPIILVDISDHPEVQEGWDYVDGVFSAPVVPVNRYFILASYDDGVYSYGDGYLDAYVTDEGIYYISINLIKEPHPSWVEITSEGFENSRPRTVEQPDIELQMTIVEQLAELREQNTIIMGALAAILQDDAPPELMNAIRQRPANEVIEVIARP